MRHLWEHGYPVPEVHDSDGADLVMERLDGATMLETFPRRPWKLRRWAAMLADLHHRLARVPLPGFEVPRRFGTADVLVHGDLHPDNVMLTAAGPVVIDWPNTAVGSPGAEVASTWIIMATSETDGSGLARAVQSSARSGFVRMFLKRADVDAARTMLPVMAEHRLADRNLRAGEAEAIHRLMEREGAVS